MDGRMGREVNYLRRVRQFVEAQRASTPGLSGEPHFTALADALADAIAGADRHAREQFQGTVTAVQRTQDRKGLEAELRTLYLEPVRVYATALARDERFQLEMDQFRLPPVSARLETFRAAAHGMLAATTAAKDGFPGLGMPADFLDRFTAALAKFESALTEHSVERTRVLEAKTGLRTSLERAWETLRLLDGYFRMHRPKDAELLASWREVRRSRSSVQARRAARLEVKPGGEPGVVSGKPTDAGSDVQRPAA